MVTLLSSLECHAVGVGDDYKATRCRLEAKSVKSSRRLSQQRPLSVGVYHSQTQTSYPLPTMITMYLHDGTRVVTGKRRYRVPEGSCIEMTCAHLHVLLPDSS
jgi:hypothetical protein